MLGIRHLWKPPDLWHLWISVFWSRQHNKTLRFWAVRYIERRCRPWREHEKNATKIWHIWFILIHLDSFWFILIDSYSTIVYLSDVYCMVHYLYILVPYIYVFLMEMLPITCPNTIAEVWKFSCLRQCSHCDLKPNMSGAREQHIGMVPQTSNTKRWSAWVSNGYPNKRPLQAVPEQIHLAWLHTERNPVHKP